MPIDFPTSPTTGDTYTIDNKSWTYNGFAWRRTANLSVTNLTITGNAANALTIGGGITVSGNILPSANVTYDLGSSSLRFNDLYLAGNSIFIGSETISVNNGAFTFTSNGGSQTGNVFFGNVFTDELIVKNRASITGNLNVSGNIGLALVGNLAPNAAVTIRGYSDNSGTTSFIKDWPKTLFLGGTFNQAYNSGNAAILAIANYSNDTSDIIYPIYAEDENGVVDFYLFAGNNTAGTDKLAYFGGNINVRGNILPVANVSQNLGSSTSWWNLVYGKSVQAQYADLAENYVADKNYDPGTVVVFGGSAEITTTTITHDTAVAGVISSNPAYLMNASTEGLPVALTGRVPCLVKGPVNKGSILTTSDQSGIAESMIDSLYKPGCILGKSLAIIEDSSVQMIEIVVGRF